MHHVELNTCSSFSRSNTRFTSPQTCHIIAVPYKHQIHLIFLNEPKTWGMTRCTKQVLSKGCMHADQLLPSIARRRGMSYKWGCINTYLGNPICSTHSLACKTSSHQVAWWICQQVDLRCPHSQCKCPIFADDLLWNDGGHQCALFLHVEPDCWSTWLHSHCLGVLTPIPLQLGLARPRPGGLAQ